MLGLIMLSFSIITRVFTYNTGLLPKRPAFFEIFKYFSLESGLGIGLFLIVLGIIIIVKAIDLSYSPGFENLGFARSVRLVYGACLSILTGGQVIFTSFVLSMLGINIAKIVK